MSHSKNYDNNKNNVQSKSNLVEDLNEILSVENASIDRIISRIDQTSLQKLNQRLKQHLEETNSKKQASENNYRIRRKANLRKSRFIKVSPACYDYYEKEIYNDR